MATATRLSAQDIRAAREDHPKLRARDLAETLGISEAALLTADIGAGVTRIDAHPDTLMPAAEKLGAVLALTRTPSCVHEKDGEYANYTSGEHAAMVLNEAIDLRIFPSHWGHAFAVETPGEDAPKRSLQIFDAAGDAVHKIHLRAHSNHDVWDEVVASVKLDDQSDEIDFATRTGPSAPQANPEKRDDLIAGWDAMTDTHQFNTLTRRLKMNRLGAYRLAGEPHVRRLQPDVLQGFFEEIAKAELGVMIFVGNHGCIQIHGGKIHTIKPMGPWINILDPGFNLHLRGDMVAEVYEVHKPTKRGMAISVEAFDAEGGIILQVFPRATDTPDPRPAYAGIVAALPGLTEEVSA